MQMSYPSWNQYTSVFVFIYRLLIGLLIEVDKFHEVWVYGSSIRDPAPGIKESDPIPIDRQLFLAAPFWTFP